MEQLKYFEVICQFDQLDDVFIGKTQVGGIQQI